MAKRKSVRRASVSKQHYSSRKVELRSARPVASPLAYTPAAKPVRRKALALDLTKADRREANHARHKERVAAVAASPHETKRSVSKLALYNVREPDVRKSSEKARDRLTCKKRPDSREAARHKRGSGAGGKRFVPWCG